MKHLRPKDVKKLRELAGLSQFELAREIGCDRSRVSLIEAGYQEASDEELNAILTTVRAAFQKRVHEFERLAGAEAA